MSSYPFRTALITGASSGIGEAMAHCLGRAGVPTVLVARRGDRLAELARLYPGFEVLGVGGGIPTCASYRLLRKMLLR